MHYQSTRQSALSVPAAQAILQGISTDGGLFVPETLPQLTQEDIAALCGMDYMGRAKRILSLFLTDYTEAEISAAVDGAYASGRFDHADVAPVTALDGALSVLELWHGPTLAFKDMALQLLPRLMPLAMEKAGDGKQVLILVATSGDTGKAALEGFRDVAGTRIAVFYPEEGVALAQKLQMVTQEGDNVHVCAVKGNFDDAQTGVKKIFADDAFNGALSQKGWALSSANSINWGRLVPQIVYYFSAYADLCRRGDITVGKKVNFVVPTGNFGNILAGYYAKHMGLPVNKLVCASNRNNVLTDFFDTGRYDRTRPFYKTMSPSMDILISSNLERLLYAICDKDEAQVRAWMAQLQGEGVYQIATEQAQKLRQEFWAGCASEEDTAHAMAAVFQHTGYVMDTHTAVGYSVYRDYLRQTGDETHTVLVSTASPFKFSRDVMASLFGPAQAQGDELDLAQKLAQATGWRCPEQIAALREMPVRHEGSCKKEEMEQDLLRWFA